MNQLRLLVPGTRNFAPARRVSDFKLFSARIEAAVVPYCWAMLLSVSPERTVWVRTVARAGAALVVVVLVTLAGLAVARFDDVVVRRDVSGDARPA